MATRNLLYKKEIEVVDGIKIVVPTVGEILEREDQYYDLVSILTAMPIDMMVALDELGIDFTTITDYDLFLMFAAGFANRDMSLVFGDLDFSKFEIRKDPETNVVALYDDEHGIVIGRRAQKLIAATLRKIHGLEKNRRKPGNEEAKKYLLERARVKMARGSKKKTDSSLEKLIIAMVNCTEYKYNYESTKDLTIYQFNQSVKQIAHRVNYDKTMIGVYAGTVDSKTLNKDEFYWLGN